MIDEVLKTIIVNADVQKTVRPNLSSKIRTTFYGAGKGKDYPGFKPLLTYRALAWNSTIVYSIIIFRRNQVLKKEKIFVPYDQFEPPFRFSVLEYPPESLYYIPSIDEVDANFVLGLHKKARAISTEKTEAVQLKIKQMLTQSEKSVLAHIEEKHVNFYIKRNLDVKNILTFLKRPDPYFSETNDWTYILSLVLEDILTIDRGVLLKIRDEHGKLIALTPLDGTTVKPVLDEETGKVLYYVQEVDNAIVNEYLDRRDVILFRQNLTPDTYFYGYSVPPIEILYKAILSDIFIDKGNLDYYRKGGSIPEGIITVEPPQVKDSDVYPQLSREQLESIQRQLQAIMMGDYTQVPILSGGKFTWIDFKGKRRDMQFKELAEYVARKICAVYQVSPQDVGILEGVNRATAEVMASMTKAKGLEPLLATMSKGFDSVIEEFRPQLDIKLWFKEDDLEKERDWWSYIQGQLNAGYRTINEVRMEKGFDPVPWGDTPFAGLRNWEPKEQRAQPAMSGAIPGAQLPPQLAGMQGGQNEGQGLDILQQLLGKSLLIDFSSPKEVIELVNDENYLKDRDLLKSVLSTIGATDVVEFIEYEANSDLEISAEDLVKSLYRRYIADETVLLDSNGFYLELLAKSDIGFKEALEIVTQNFNCTSVPKIDITNNENGKYIEVSLSACKKIPSSVETPLDELFVSLDENPYKLRIVISSSDYGNVQLLNVNNLIRYSISTGERIKKKNFDKFVEKFGYGNTALLFADKEHLDDLAKILFGEDELNILQSIASNTVNIKENVLYYLATKYKDKYGTLSKINKLILIPDFVHYVHFIFGGKLNKKDVFFECDQINELIDIFVLVRPEEYDRVLDMFVDYLHSIDVENIYVAYEKDRLSNFIKFIDFEFGYKRCFEPYNVVTYYDYVKSKVKSIKNILIKKPAEYFLFGENIDKDLYEQIKEEL